MLTIFLCVCKDTTFEAHRDERKNFFNTYNEKVFSACHKKSKSNGHKDDGKVCRTKEQKKEKAKKTTTLNHES